MSGLTSRRGRFIFWQSLRSYITAQFDPARVFASKLQKRGLQLIDKEAGNFQLPGFPGLIVKESYWRWPHRNLAGNTIDFFCSGSGNELPPTLCAKSPDRKGQH